MSIKNKVIEIAINEIQSRTLQITKQILAVHEPLLTSSKPEVKRVDNVSCDDQYLIYFSLREYDYYFVIVVIEQDENLLLSTAYIEAHVRVYLKIWSQDVPPEEISGRLKLIPTETRDKDSSKSTRFQNYREHFWMYEPQKDIPDNLERKISILLGYLDPIRAELATLSKYAQFEIGIYYCNYSEWMGGWHLDALVLKKIAKLGCSVDFDLDAYGPELPE